MEAVEALSKLPPEVAVPLLQEAAQDPERLVRRLVAEVAADLPTLSLPGGGPPVPAGAPILRRLQQDPDAGVRFRAAVLLLRFGTLPPPDTPLARSEPRPVKPVPRPEPETPAQPPPDAGAPNPPDAGAAAGTPATIPPAGGPETPAPAGESAVEKLAHAGLAAFARKDYTTALKQMDRAARECAKKKNKSEAACDLISAELPLRIGQIYEQRGDFSEAMAEYEKAQRAGRHLKGHADLLAATAQAAGALSRRLGAVVRPKGSGADCKEVTTWLEPGGPYTFTVDGRSQVVNLRAGDTIRLGECH
jgi:tetratricopeptide (TPR) repeat protein